MNTWISMFGIYRELKQVQPRFEIPLRADTGTRHGEIGVLDPKAHD